MTESLVTTIDDRGVAYLTITKPQTRNALDDLLIAGLLNEIRTLSHNPGVRILVLGAEGKLFSSGADLAWMKSMAAYGESENLQDAQALAALMYALYSLPIPTIAKVNGDAYGGAVGLIACCDIAVSDVEATFSFSEVKLGLIPAVISPYIVEAIGLRRARAVFLTGEKISAFDAFRMGLLQECVSAKDLNARVEKNIKQLLCGGPDAQKAAKKLLMSFSDIDESRRQDTAKCIARIRVSAEAQEGLSAFLEKRMPEWIASD
ncbi:MAG TPA: enoyl-CoA hydratase/isomerase family protein [Gammaproteobacteria bacterium]|nr:enoyl-CoA hydratase/isomerase family protein [Gammaproteobacteria bacterium]